ncbi:MAG: FAD:protein FMN transferase [Pirellulales bacterium]|nr:FAD:protein FMN transferase [Pirellulales bacterium]
MSDFNQHSRRDFLQGKAAARTLIGKAQDWADAASELLGVSSSPGAALHLHASRRAMACQFAVQFHEADRDATEDVLAAFDTLESLETQMTIYRDHSEVIEINLNAADNPVEVEPGLFCLFELASKLSYETGGAFDITSSPLSRAWGFLRREGRLPSGKEIDAALAKVGYEKVKLDSERRTIHFREPGVEINLNSIGKGYALDRVAQQLDGLGVRDYLWHGGSSSVLARGGNRADPQGAWTLGLRDPLQPVRRIAEFHLRDQALGTAGGATQFFQHEGRSLSHIIDPRTGWPAEGVLTATVVAPSAAEADALATAFFVMGIEAVADYCALHPAIGAVLVCPGEEPGQVALHDFGLTEDSWASWMSKDE